MPRNNSSKVGVLVLSSTLLLQMCSSFWSFCSSRANAQDAIAEDIAKKTDDKQTYKADSKAVLLYTQAWRQYQSQLALQEANIQAAKAKLTGAKSSGKTALIETIKDYEAKAAVTRTYVSQYQEYVTRLQNRLRRDRSLVQQDGIDLTADDATRRLVQEQAALPAASANPYSPAGLPNNQYGAGYQDPYANDGSGYGDYYPPDYTNYGRSRYWGESGPNGSRARAGATGRSGGGAYSGGHR